MKLILKILVIIFGVIALLIGFRNPVIKMLASAGVESVLGMKLEIQKLDLNLGKSLIDIEGITLYNPKDFPDPVMAEVGKVYVDIDPGKILTGQILVHDVQLDLREFLVVRNKEGELNLDRLKAVAESKQTEDKKTEPAKTGKAPEVNIRNLHLKIGKVVFKDYSKGGKPTVKEFNLNLDEKHQNIQDLNAVAALIVFKVLTQTTIGQLTDIDIAGLQGLVGGTLKGVVGGAKGVLGTAPELLKNTADGVQGTLKSILGNN